MIPTIKHNAGKGRGQKEQNPRVIQEKSTFLNNPVDPLIKVIKGAKAGSRAMSSIHSPGAKVKEFPDCRLIPAENKPSKK